MKRGVVVLCLALSLPLLAGGPRASAVPGGPTDCRVRAGGTLETGDTFGGQARSADGGALGEWTHHSPDGEVLHGTAEDISCRTDGGGPGDPPSGTESNIVTVFGTGTWDGMSVDFEAYAEDRAEPNTRDFYGIFVLVDGAVIYYAQGTVVSGNVQILNCNASCPSP